MTPSDDPFEHAWQALAQAGVTDRPWTERPWMEPAVLAAGPLAIRLERALREGQALTQRIGDALRDWDRQDHQDARLLQRLNRALAPRWWQRRQPWSGPDTEARIRHLATVQRTLLALDRALTLASQGLGQAVGWAEEAPHADSTQPAWQAVADRLRFLHVGIVNQAQLLGAWRDRCEREQRQWAQLQAVQVALPS